MKRINVKTVFTCILFIQILCASRLIYSQNSPDENLETLTKNRRNILANKHFEDGMTFFHQGLYELAIDEFKSSISLIPTNHMVYYFKGMAHESINQNEQALFNLNASLSIKNDFAEALFSRAVLNYKIEEYEKAIDDLRNLQNIPAGETEAVYFRGINYDEGLSQTEFDGIFTMSNQKPYIYYHLGMCFFKLESYDSALNNYTRALHLNPNDDNIYVNRGLAYLKKDLKGKARKDFEEALKLNPNNSLASFNLTNTIENDHEAEIKTLTELIKKNNNFAMAYAQRAYIYFMTGNLEFARMDYDSAIFLDPDNYSYYLERGLILDKENKINEAILNYQTAMTLEPSDYRCWMNLGNAYYKLKDYKSSLEYYDQAIQLNQSEGSLYYNRALCYYYSNDLTKACMDIEIAIQLEFKPAAYFRDTYCK